MPRMTSQKRSLMGSIYRAYRAFIEPLRREILPLSTLEKVKSGQSCGITGRVQSIGFWPDHLTISGAGTKGGAADWIVNDIKIGGKSQFNQSGDIPGDMFEAKSISSFVRFEAVRAYADVQLVVTYIGTEAEGCAFIAAITGTEYDPGLLDILREALSQGLAVASRGFSSRPH